MKNVQTTEIWKFLYIYYLFTMSICVLRAKSLVLVDILPLGSGYMDPHILWM